jgi:peptidoglycan/xylan/chitin deacetylase (PgdA/CDA1 family)
LLADPGDNRRFVAFTLDDGYRNNAEFAAPIFGRYGIPYTIFINPGFVERTRTMWWETAAAIARKADLIDFDFGNGPESLRTTTTARKFAAFERFAAFVQSIDEDEAVARIDAVARDRHNIDPMAIVDSLVMDEAELRELARDPLVHLGAHTMTHVNLRRVSRERLKDEIEQSAATVQAYVERRPLSFAYPYGWTTAVGGREAKAVADAGFAAAVTTQPGVLDAACLDHPMALPRVSLNGLYQKKRYVRALLSGLPFKLM